MDLSKSIDFFDPRSVEDTIHIIGCGSVGSTVAELLARFGLTNFCLYDFDMVENRNIANQMFTVAHLFRPKTDALLEILTNINPEIKEHTVAYTKGWTGQKLYGYVFLCVDNIDLRRKIVEENKFNQSIKAVFDLRTGLTTCQHYAADWRDFGQKKALLDTMNFSHEEAAEATPVSACNVPLCVAPTVRWVANIGVCNFINFAKGEPLKQRVIGDPFKMFVETF